MALRLIAVTDIFTDKAHLNHCGLIIISERVDRYDRELPIITVPRSRARASDKEKEDESYLFWTGSVERVEYYTDQTDSGFGLICFYFNKDIETSASRD